MIMCCMNCVSAAVCDGNFGRVDDGNVRVGLPGAPGWTTIGFVSRFCAETGDNKQTGEEYVLPHCNSDCRLQF